ncbi:hypothetical protein [Niabella aquatica]
MTDILAITVDMKVSNGYIEYCRFTLTGDRQDAEELFERLNGIADIGLTLPLRLSLITLNATPNEVLAIKYCRLDELAWNSRLITKEIFNHYNLG